MCGIAGIISFNSSIDINILCQMTNVIKHRGPDDEGYVLVGTNNVNYAHGDDSVQEAKYNSVHVNSIHAEFFLGLGHRRLSIIDLSYHGHQPMHDDDNKLVIVYNGEIYNFIEIREDLIKKGYKFKTSCDTEVILYAYKEWGKECVKRFNGMWSFSIWDSDRKILFCSRDRLGVKPFYYYRDSNKLLFGSEIKQIIQDSSIQRRANDSKVFDYLVFGLGDYSNETFFKDIYNLPGGCNLTVSLDKSKSEYGDVKIERYWELNVEQSEMSYEHAVERIQEELKRSVRLRLRSDVPVGSSLSGGLDSTSILCLVSELMKEQGGDIHEYKTFTAFYSDDGSVDESVYSKQVSKMIGSKEIFVDSTLDILKKDIYDLIWHQEEPFSGLSIFANWCVMKQVGKEGIKVLLSGQGGDESLLGYDNYFCFYFKYLIKHLKFGKVFSEVVKVRRNSKLSGLSLPKFFLFIFQNVFPGFRFRSLLETSKEYCHDGFIDSYLHRKSVLDLYNKYDDIKFLQKSELMNMSLFNILRLEDKSSMAFSIEVRVPFVDYQFVELCASFPFEYKIKDGWSKSLLRCAMDGILPDNVRLRKDKMGFDTPQDKWIRELEPYIEGIFSNTIKSEKYIDKKKVHALLERNTIGAKYLWRVLNLELWMRIFEIR